MSRGHKDIDTNALANISQEVASSASAPLDNNKKEQILVKDQGTLDHTNKVPSAAIKPPVQEQAIKKSSDNSNHTLGTQGNREVKEDSPISLSPLEPTELFGGVNLGRRGDPRMHQAVVYRSKNPNSTLLDSLIHGGFDFPSLGDDRVPSRNIRDTEGIQLYQRKNQLCRRLRQIRVKKRSNDVSNAPRHASSIVNTAAIGVGRGTQSDAAVGTAGADNMSINQIKVYQELLLHQTSNHIRQQIAAEQHHSFSVLDERCPARPTFKDMSTNPGGRMLSSLSNNCLYSRGNQDANIMPMSSLQSSTAPFEVNNRFDPCQLQQFLLSQRCVLNWDENNFIDTKVANVASSVARSTQGLNISGILNIDDKIDNAIDVYAREHQSFVSLCLMKAGFNQALACDPAICAVFEKKMNDNGHLSKVGPS